ncbi:MAG: translation initiation factor eIF-1A [Candidatus Aenigmarchaeota archaeon]|nr:translation initiation factor eIF-1A [Candidatus Aenigmarchaeota archaeon]
MSEETKVRIADEKNGETYALVEMFYAGDKVKVICEDGKERMARIAGKIARKFWVKVGDVVLIKKWPFMDDRCDIIHVYTQSEANWLRKNGYIKNLPNEPRI